MFSGPNNRGRKVELAQSPTWFPQSQPQNQDLIWLRSHGPVYFCARGLKIGLWRKIVCTKIKPSWHIELPRVSFAPKNVKWKRIIKISLNCQNNEDFSVIFTLSLSVALETYVSISTRVSSPNREKRSLFTPTRNERGINEVINWSSLLFWLWIWGVNPFLGHSTNYMEKKRG